LCTYNFSVDPRIFPKGQIYTKNYHFSRFWGHNGEIWHEGADLGLPPQAKICIKKSLKGVYPFWENLYQKYQFWRFWMLYSHILTHSDEIWHEGSNLNSLPKPNFVKKNCLRGYTHFWQIYTKNYQFQRFWGL